MSYKELKVLAESTPGEWRKLNRKEDFQYQLQSLVIHFCTPSSYSLSRGQTSEHSYVFLDIVMPPHDWAGSQTNVIPEMDLGQVHSADEWWLQDETGRCVETDKSNVLKLEEVRNV